jgi:hypothetical protein
MYSEQVYEAMRRYAHHLRLAAVEEQIIDNNSGLFSVLDLFGPALLGRADRIQVLLDREGLAADKSGQN